MLIKSLFLISHFTEALYKIFFIPKSFSECANIKQILEWNVFEKSLEGARIKQDLSVKSQLCEPLDRHQGPKDLRP